MREILEGIVSVIERVARCLGRVGDVCERVCESVCPCCAWLCTGIYLERGSVGAVIGPCRPGAGT